jgi:hypothetical protein
MIRTHPAHIHYFKFMVIREGSAKQPLKYLLPTRNCGYALLHQESITEIARNIGLPRSKARSAS